MCAASIMPTRTRIGPAPIIIKVLVRREITGQSLPGKNEADTPAQRGHILTFLLCLCILLLASRRLSKPYKLIVRAFFRLVRSGNVCADGGLSARSASPCTVQQVSCVFPKLQQPMRSRLQQSRTRLTRVLSVYFNSQCFGSRKQPILYQLQGPATACGALDN